MNAGLYGIKNSNRDLSKKENWGKNKFTTEFPISLALYQNDQGKLPVYIKAASHQHIMHEYAPVSEVFGFDDELSSNDFNFDFESIASLDKKLNGNGEGNSTRSDVVVSSVLPDFNTDRGLEVKLTALPDNATSKNERSKQSTEIVIRPVSILHLSNVLADDFENMHNGKSILKNILKPVIEKFDTDEKWASISLVRENINLFVDTFDKVYDSTLDSQKPVLLQGIWRTINKSFLLDENAFDTFVWSSHAFALLFRSTANLKKRSKNLDRKVRSIVWVIRMLCSYLDTGKIAGEDLIHELSYGNQTDKAFAVSGKVTLPFLQGKELLNPRITKNEVNDIILGDAVEYLSPERRLDTALSIQGMLLKTTRDNKE